MGEKNNALEELLSDIDILHNLDKWIKEVNLFSITGMANQEIKHSNTLSWFFNPNENHGFKDQVIKRFLKKVVSENSGRVIGTHSFDVSLLDFSTFIVKREWNNIDILLYSEELKMVITIENKIYAPEGETQLSKYYKTIPEEFKDYEKFLYIYLTREGEEPSDPDNWCTANYMMIVEALEESLSENTGISDKVKIITSDYISMMRRNLGMDEELRKTVQRIYLEHKDAFDLVFQVTSTTHMHFYDYIKSWLNENKDKYNLNFDEEYSTASILRFTTPFIDKLFPFDEEKGDGWGSGKSFMYEIKILRNKIFLVGVLANFKRDGSKILMEYDTKAKSMIWRNVLRAKLLLTKGDIAEGLTDEIVKELDKQLKKVITSEIKNFENDVNDLIEKQKQSTLKHD